MVDRAMRSAAARSFRAVARVVEGRRPALAWPGGVVSFTFDDFPRTAWSAGGRILTDHGARGTYYAASGLSGGEPPVATAEDIRAVHLAGHEVGCHTRAHVNCAETSSERLLAELRANAAAISPLLDGRRMTSFAYPFGAASTRAKRLIRRYFITARGIQPGINRRRLDLGELRANRIYAHSFDEGLVRGLIEENAALGGWLVFYTHDVDDRPSRYGCTPRQLAAVVALATRRSEVLRVCDVAAQIRTAY